MAVIMRRASVAAHWARTNFVGKNVAIEFRWANFQLAVLPQLATDVR
jgi:hypothetical protein